MEKKKPKQRSLLKPKKKKLHTRNECLSLAQKLCKLRVLNEDGHITCISCGKELTYGTADVQGGHYISRADRATETEPDNIWPQCYGCNVGKNGNIPMYRYHLVERIGNGRVARLELMSLARQGSDDAYDALTPEDKVKATMKKSARYYDNLYYELKEQVKEAEDLWTEKNF